MKLLLSVLALLLASHSVALCSDIELQTADTENTEAQTQTRKAFARFTEGHIDYEGTTPADGSEVIRGLRFGLNFASPTRSDGSWSRWNFLSVSVKLGGGEPLDVIGRRMLHSAEVVEDVPRQMVCYRWPLEEAGGFLKVTFLLYPEQKEWMLLRVELEGDTGATIEQVVLMAYPSHTSGPEERERWIAGGDVTMALETRAQPFDPTVSAFAFFNRMAQEDAGCFLVFDPASVAGLMISGDYAVRSTLKLNPGETSLDLALGGFVEQQADEAVRAFLLEGGRNTLQFLKAADWKPRVNSADHERLFGNLRQLLADVGSPEERERFAASLSRYEQEIRGNNGRGALNAVNELRQLEKQLLSRALARWR